MIEKKPTFLVVEDNELDVEKIERGFSRLKILNQMVHVKDGYQALDILRGTNGATKLSPPFIILLDLNMPRMNGLEFLAELRADTSLSHAPVFVLTTSDRRDDIESAYKFNICGYIVKPVAMTQMIESLTTLNMYWSLSELPEGQRAYAAG